MMLRALLKFCVTTTTSLLLLMLALRAAPYTDAEFQNFLRSSTACAPPCFMNIYPGQMDFDEVMAVLQGHDWVSRIYQDARQSARTVGWRWSGAQPEALQAEEMGFAFMTRDFYVDSVLVQTGISLGRSVLYLGWPNGEICWPDARRHGSSIILDYPDYGLMLRATFPQSAPLVNLWDIPVDFTFYNRDSVLMRAQITYVTTCCRQYAPRCPITSR